MEPKTFKDLKLHPWIINQCRHLGITSPSPIQANCIPEILKGKDCIGAAKTGSGKTLAFLLPIIQKLADEPYGVFALILTPTRELALQISQQASVIGRAMNLEQALIVGGGSFLTQGQLLAKKPHLVIATPGRMADLIVNTDIVSFDRLAFLVLDEADILLSGQNPKVDGELKAIFNYLPKKKQNLFFSATMTDALDKLQHLTGHEVFFYQQSSTVATVDTLKQYYVLCPVDAKEAYLIEIVRKFRDGNEKGLIMIFVSSCSTCQALSMIMTKSGYENIALYGMMYQRERQKSLGKFKSHQIQMLISTGVASRGLDIPSVQLVINHSLPMEPKEYVHRVGRTARFGRTGQAITLVTPYQIDRLKAVEEHIGTKLSEMMVNDKNVGKLLKNTLMHKSIAFMDVDNEKYLERKKRHRTLDYLVDGLNPIDEEAKLDKERKQKRKNRNEQNKQNTAKRKKLMREQMVERRAAHNEGNDKQSTEGRMKTWRIPGFDESIVLE